jgi:hypothetical protein
MSEWGNPTERTSVIFIMNQIVIKREPGELKHLSTLRKREYSQSSGERNGRSPNHWGLNPCGVVGPDESEESLKNSRMTWESQPEKVRARYAKFGGTRVRYLSSTVHANTV